MSKKALPPASLVWTEHARADLHKIRLLAAPTVVCHLTASVVTMVMAFYKSTRGLGTDFSTTLVFCAFVGLIALLWSAVALFEVWAGGREAPKWEWHNRQFNLAVGVALATVLSLLPAIFLFVLHAQGQDVDQILPELAPSDRDTAVALIATAIFLGLSLLCSVWYTSVRLKHRSELDKLSRPTLGLVGVKLTFDLMFFGALVADAVKVGGNSGPILCAVVAFGTIVLFVYLLVQHKGGRFNSEALLTHWRQACICQVLLTYGEFWIAFVLFLLRQRYDADFFASINAMSGARRGLVGVALATMFLVIVNYGALLYFHAKCMARLDGLGGMEARMGTGTKTTALELTETKEMEAVNASAG